MKTTLINLGLRLLNSKHLSYLLEVFVTLLLPVLIVARRYDYINRGWVIQVATPVLFVLFWAMLRFWSEISEAITTMKEGFSRELGMSLMRMGPYILLMFIGVFIEIFSEHYMFVVGVLFWTQLSGVVLRANHRRLKRKELIERGYVNVLSP